MSTSFSSTVIAIIFLKDVLKISLIISALAVVIHLNRALMCIETIIFLFV